jgi:hypothetical protein
MDYRIVCSIIIVIALIFLLALLYARGHKEVVKKIILSLVVKAEQALGSKTGGLKYAYVIEKIYDKLPFIITLFFTKEELNRFIESGVQKLKQTLDSGATLESYENEHFRSYITDGE